MTDRLPGVKQVTIKRAIRAAQDAKAGLVIVRPDGTIEIQPQPMPNSQQTRPKDRPKL